MIDQKQENERTKEAFDRENKFLKDEVMGKGVDTDNQPKENLKTEIEKSIED